MASSSENPQDEATLKELIARMRAIVSEGERFLGMAGDAHDNAELERQRAAQDRAQAAKESKVRKAKTGTGTQERTSEAVGETVTQLERELAVQHQINTAAAEELRIRREISGIARGPALTSGERKAAAQLRSAEEAKRQAQLAEQRAVGAAQFGGRGLETGHIARQFEAEQQRVRQQLEAQRQAAAAFGGRGVALPAGASDQYLAELAAAQRRQAALAEQRARASMHGMALPFTGLPVGSPSPGGPGVTLHGGGHPSQGTGVSLSETLAAESATKELSDAQKVLYEDAQKAKFSQRELSQALGYQARIVGTSSNAFQKHGYLTSEFIQAAAKGQVTFRELSAQVGGTIAKFAGWTAAASAVYGAVAAVSALGKGAIASANAVQLLNRVIDQTKRTDPGTGNRISDDQLQGRLSDFAEKFNMPIEDVGQAVYGSLKAFRGDLPQALQASEQALFAVKVGELSAADATKSLTAIVNGFQLSASALPGLFDTINQAQNRFGGNTGQMVQGVAKAGGAFRLAGGHYRELIALLQAGSRLTGRTPVEVATAVQRSAGRVLTSQGMEALKKAGLDPNQSYMDLLKQAGEMAQGASPERVQELARALIPSGGQFASTFAPLLQDIARGKEGQFGKILPELSPDNVQGSAARELARVLKEPGERIKQITVDLERLGVQLARLGAGALPGALLSGLHFVLDTLNDILKVFNSIAQVVPFHGAVVGALELAAVLKLVRRFDVGASLPTGKSGSAYSVFREGLRRPEVPRARAEVLQGLDDERKVIGAGRERAALRTSDLAVQARLAEKRVVDLVAMEKAGNATMEEVIAAQQQSVSQKNQLLASQQLEEQYRMEAVRVQEQINAVERAKIKVMEDLLVVTAANSVNLKNSSLNRPITEGPEALAGAAGRPYTREQAIMAGEMPAAEAAARARRFAGVRAGLGTAWTGAQAIGPIGWGAEKVREGYAAASTGMGQMMQRMRSGGIIARSTAGGLGLVGDSLLFVRRASKSAIVGLKTMIESLGLLEKAGLVVLTGYLAYKNVYEQPHKELEAGAAAGDSGRIRDIREASKWKGPTYSENLPIIGKHGFFGSPGNLIRTFGDHLGHILPGVESMDEAHQEMVRSYQNELKAFNDARKKGLYKTQKQIKDALKSSRAGSDPEKQMAALEQAIESEQVSLGFSQYGSKAQREAAKRNLHTFRVMQSVLQAAGGDMVAAINAIHDIKGVQTFSAGTAARLQIGQVTPTRAARAYGYGSARTWEQLGIGGISVEEAGPQIDADRDAATKALQDELNRKLSVARSPRQQNFARTDFIHKLRAARLGPIRAEIARLEAEGKQFPSLAAQNNKAIEQLRKGLDVESAAIDETATEIQHARFQTRQESRSQATDLAVARLTAAGDPVGALRKKLVDDINNLRAIQEEYGRRSKEYGDAYKQAFDDQQALVAGEVSRYDALRDLQSSAQTVGATDEVKQQDALQAAADKLNNARRHGLKGDALVPYVKAYYDAQDATMQAVKAKAEQTAADMLAAQRTYALSTIDPSNSLAAATINLGFDRLALGQAKTPAERLNALAAINNSLRARREAKLTERAETIDYQLAMERIDKQTAAAEYEALAKRVRNNKELYRQYKLKAKELMDDASGGYELDIANIKIPTPYEVTRAIAEGRSGASQYRQHVVNNHRTNINFYVRDSHDLAKVGAMLERHLPSTRSTLRAQGLLN